MYYFFKGIFFLLAILYFIALSLRQISPLGVAMIAFDVSIHSVFLFLYHRDAQIIFHSSTLICEIYRAHLNQFNYHIKKMTTVNVAGIKAKKFREWFQSEHSRFTAMVSQNNRDLVSQILFFNSLVLIPLSAVSLYRLFYTPLDGAEWWGVFAVWSADLFLYTIASLPVAMANRAFYGAIRHLPAIQWLIQRNDMKLKLKYDALYSRLAEGKIEIGFYIGSIKVVSFGTLFEVLFLFIKLQLF